MTSMEKMTRKRIFLFIIISALFLAALSFLYYKNRKNVFLIICMFTPAISVLITRLLTHEGFGHSYLNPHFRGNLKWYFSTWLLTPVVAYLGTVLYFLIFPGNFNLLGSSFSVSSGLTTTSQCISQLMRVIPLAILINPLMGIPLCFGEEYGWRGYLLPKLNEKYTPLMSTILTGIIWGVWHAPFVAMSYNYGAGHPLVNILAMVVFSVVIGIIQGFLFFKTRSIWPSVLFHAAENGMDLWAPSDLFMSKTPNFFIGPDLVGIIGGIGFIVVAICCLPFLLKKAHRTMNVVRSN